MQRSLVLFILSITPIQSAFSHGGQYRAPVPKGPVTGIAPKDAGQSGTGIQTPGPQTSAGPVQTRKPRPLVVDAGWRGWWKFNAPELISLRSSGVAAPSLESLGPNARAAAAEWKPVARALDSALNENAIDMVDSALLARSRSATTQSADDVFPAIWPFVAHPSRSVQRSALLSLGLLPCERSTPVLISFLGPQGKSDPVTNGVAAIALGFLSQSQGIPALERTIQQQKNSETCAAAVIALGLFEKDRRRIVMFLMEQLERRGFPRLARIQIPISLGRMGETASPAVPLLLKTLGKGQDTPLRRSCVIALGHLASPDDDRARSRLIATARSSSDATLRGLARIALGRIAARVLENPTIYSEDSLAGRRFLLRDLTHCPRSSDFGWTAIATSLALQGTGTEDPDRKRASDVLKHRLNTTRSQDARCSAAVALALLGASDAGKKIRELLNKESTEQGKADLALALGLMRDVGSVAQLEDLTTNRYPPAIRERSLVALALISREQASSVALEILNASQNPTERIFALRMLARCGDASALPQLVRDADNSELDDLTRAFAIVALGKILERQDISWNDRLASGSNYMTTCASVTELLDIF